MILGYQPLCIFNCSVATPRTVAHWAPLSMGFSRQEYWSGLPFPSPGEIPQPRMEPTSLVSPTPAVQFSRSVVSDSLHPTDCSTPGLSVHHRLPEFCSNSRPSSHLSVTGGFSTLSHLGSPLGYLILCNLVVLCECLFFLFQLKLQD